METLQEVQDSIFGKEHDWLNGHSVSARIEKNHANEYKCRVFSLWKDGEEKSCSFKGLWHETPRAAADEFKRWTEIHLAT